MVETTGDKTCTKRFKFKDWWVRLDNTIGSVQGGNDIYKSTNKDNG